MPSSCTILLIAAALLILALTTGYAGAVLAILLVAGVLLGADALMGTLVGWRTE